MAIVTQKVKRTKINSTIERGTVSRDLSVYPDTGNGESVPFFNLVNAGSIQVTVGGNGEPPVENTGVPAWVGGFRYSFDGAILTFEGAGSIGELKFERRDGQPFSTTNPDNVPIVFGTFYGYGPLTGQGSFNKQWKLFLSSIPLTLTLKQEGGLGTHVILLTPSVGANRSVLLNAGSGGGGTIDTPPPADGGTIDPIINFNFVPITTNQTWPEFDNRRDNHNNRIIGEKAVLENEFIRVEVWKNYGGCPSHISRKNGPNLVNNFDLGRQLQYALYRGGRTTNKANATIALNWAPNGIYGYELAPDGQFRPAGTANDPIQAGSTFQDPSEMLAFGMNNTTIYTKIRMQNWSSDDDPTDVIMEQWVKLDGKAMRQYVKFTHNRTWDTRTHEALAQEYPCLYVNYDLTPSVQYALTPGGSIGTKANHDQTPFRIGEPWVACLGNNDSIVGLWNPRLYATTQKNFAFGANSTEFDNACNYTSFLPILNQEWNGVYYNESAVIVGSVDEIRTWSNAQPNNVKNFSQTFNAANGLGFWFYKKADNVTGFPLVNQVQIRPTTAYAELTSPFLAVPANTISQIKVRMANTGSNTSFRLFFSKTNQPEDQAINANQFFNFTTTNDGTMRDYTFNTSSNGSFSGVIEQLKLVYQTRNENAMSGENWFVESITTS